MRCYRLLAVPSCKSYNFYSRTPYEVRRQFNIVAELLYTFLLTHPIRGATSTVTASNSHGLHFYSRTPYEVRLDNFEIRLLQSNFYSRTPYEVRPSVNKSAMQRAIISTHAPHTRCDGEFRLTVGAKVIISTHAPHTRCDGVGEKIVFGIKAISTHAPHTRCDSGQVPTIKQSFISTHAPHTRCDSVRQYLNWGCRAFLLTHPIRGATAEYSIYSASHHNMERTLNNIILYENIVITNYAFFEANLPFILHHRRFARLLLRLKYYNSLRIICVFCTYVLYPSFPVVTKIIEPQTVLFFINY